MVNVVIDGRARPLETNTREVADIFAIAARDFEAVKPRVRTTPRKPKQTKAQKKALKKLRRAAEENGV